MNHQPFRDWLLSEERLSEAQTKTLQEHLLTFEPCRQMESAWMEVDSLFQKVPQVEPAPGFTSRWQSHLAAHQQQKQYRRAWTAIGLTAGIVALMLVLSGALILNILEAPDTILVVWLSRLIGLASIYYAVQDIFSSISGNISIVTAVGMFFLVGIISFMSVLWLTALRKFSMVRRSI